MPKNIICLFAGGTFLGDQEGLRKAIEAEFEKVFDDPTLLRKRVGKVLPLVALRRKPPN